MTAVMYAGYGSNLDPVDWAVCARPAHRVDPAGLRPVTPCLLLDHRLTFNHRAGRWGGGAANVWPSPGDVVPCMTFAIDDEAVWSVLDAKEGVGRVPGKGTYERCELPALFPDGTVEMVITYRLTKHKLTDVWKEGPVGLIPPSEDYLEAVTRGLAHHGLSDAHLGPASEGRSTPPIQHVFVYGTLLDGEERGWVLDAYERRAVTVEGVLCDLGDRGYPGLMPGEGRVHGEVVRLPDDGVLLARLDQIEGMHAHGAPNNLYRRGFVKVQCEDESVWAWTYWWNGMDAGEPIASGDWRARNLQ
jgi:gamma-glutamylcyclotransferase (GGCT)/AIG2-like uncharacterized protein YtfP